MSNIPIVFSEPDSPEAQALLKQAFEQRQQPFPQVGLLFKVSQQPDGSEQMVNWQITDAEQIQAIALGMTLAEQSKVDNTFSTRRTTT
jgi:hypothetical protein